MDSTTVQSTHGFVNTVQIGDSSGGGASAIWNKSTSISFVLFMVIGFCATLAAIGLCVGAFLLFRRYQRRRMAQFSRDVEAAAATIPEPKELYVVVHPGGHADVAHKDLDSSPRKRVLQILPIKLSSATIDRERNSPTDDTAIPLKDKWPFSPPTLHLTASASRATPPEPHNGGHGRFQRLPLAFSDIPESPKIKACHEAASEAATDKRKSEQEDNKKNGT